VTSFKFTTVYPIKIDVTKRVGVKLLYILSIFSHIIPFISGF